MPQHVKAPATDKRMGSSSWLSNEEPRLTPVPLTECRLAAETSVDPQSDRARAVGDWPLSVLFFWVLLAHIGLMLFLSWGWQEDQQGLMTPIHRETVSIKAYMVSAEQLAAIKAKKEHTPSLGASTSVQQRAVVEQVQKPSNVLGRETKAFRVKQSAETPSTEAISLVPDTMAFSNTKLERPDSIVPEAIASEVKTMQPQMLSKADTPSASQFSFESTAHLSDNSPDKPELVGLDNTTQKYLARQRARGIDAAQQEALQQSSGSKSMSEMDGEMQVLVLSDENTLDTAVTLDSRIDPNRIVKKGDTCYRIVKVGTPINPHAENLGFPFNCGGDKVKQAIQQALEKHLLLMGVSRKSIN